MMVNSENIPSEPTEPPPKESTVLKVAALGGAGAVIAGLAGLLFPPGEGAAEWVNDYLVGARVILSVVAMIIAGGAITLRPLWAGSWFAAGIVFLLAGFGHPASWDTFRLVGFILCGVATAGALMILLPIKWRMIIASGAMLFHFSGVFDAIIGPPPAPFLATQMWTYIYRPYLQPVYIVNAYQFYSPDPGPATELWFCIDYEEKINDPVQMAKLEQDESGNPKKGKNKGLLYKPMLENDEPVAEPIFDANGQAIFTPPLDRFGNELKRPITDSNGNPQYVRTSSWLKIPRRPKDLKDPLGQSYYRRLSLTENATHQDNTLAPFHLLEIQSRRTVVQAEFPISTRFDDPVQFQWPSQNVQTFILPSYVRHIAHEYKRDDRKIVGIKVYRVRHEIIPPDRFANKTIDGQLHTGGDPYDPTLYWPYFMGDFTAEGELKNPNDPLLYWLLPIVHKPNVPIEDYNKPVKKLSDYHKLFEDYVEKHAGSPHRKGESQ